MKSKSSEISNIAYLLFRKYLCGRMYTVARNHTLLPLCLTRTYSGVLHNILDDKQYEWQTYA